MVHPDHIERVLLARLSHPPDPQSRPWDYLVSCYNRSVQQQHSLALLRNKDFSARLGQALSGLKQLLVSYSGLLLTMNMFPQVLLGLSPLLCTRFLRYLYWLMFKHTSLCNTEPAQINSHNSVLQPPDAERLGARQLYESLVSRSSPLPKGFLEDLAARFEDEGLDELITPTSNPGAQSPSPSLMGCVSK